MNSKRGMHIANFSVITPEEMNNVKPVDPFSTWHLLQNDQEQAADYVSSLIKTNKSPQNSESYCFLLRKTQETLTNTRHYKNEF